MFTIGRGNDVQVAAIEALRERFVGRDADELLADMGAMWRELVHDSQLRWLGPEKGVMHMAVGAVVNALWDLKAKRAGLPLWELLADDEPRGAGRPRRLPLPDRRADAATRRSRSCGPRSPGAPPGASELLASGYPAYATSPGWLGYDDEKLARLCREAVDGRLRADQAQGRRRTSTTTSAG